MSGLQKKGVGQERTGSNTRHHRGKGPDTPALFALHNDRLRL